MGSSKRVNPTALAYIAGFLDGDGCIKARIEKRTYYTFGLGIRIVVSFSQHTRNKHVLEWIHNQLQTGSISDYVNKKMSEYVIYDAKFIERLLKALKPYIVNKTKQADLALRLLGLKDRYKNKKSLHQDLDFAIKIRDLNSYPKKNSFSSPVTTDSDSIGRDSVSSNYFEKL